MIEAPAEPAFAKLAAALERRARMLAEARAEQINLDRQDANLTWRRADLLWPLFTKG